MEKSLTSINVFVYQMHIEYLEKANDILISSPLLDPKVSNAKRVEYDCWRSLTQSLIYLSI